MVYSEHNTEPSGIIVLLLPISVFDLTVELVKILCLGFRVRDLGFTV